MDTKQVFDYLTEHHSATVAAMVAEIGINKNRVYAALDALGCVSRREGKYSLWSLPPTEAQRESTHAAIQRHLRAIHDLLEKL